MTDDLTLTGSVDAGAFAASLAACVRRHWNMRSAVTRDSDQIVQTVLDPSASCELAIHDLRGVADRDARVSAIVQHLYTDPFDLSAGSVFRAGLISVGDRHHRLVVSADHAMLDGSSREILLRDLLSTYSALVADSSASPDDVLVDLDHQYLDWADHQWRLLATAYKPTVARYWNGRLDDGRALMLPYDAASDAEVGPAIACGLLAEPALSSKLRNFLREQRCSEPVALLSLVFALLHRKTGQRDLSIVTPTSARPRELSGVVGHFTVPLIIRVQIPEGVRFRELCGIVHDALWEAYEWRRIPLYAAYRPSPGQTRFAFNYQRRAHSSSLLAGVQVEDTADRYAPGFALDMDLSLQMTTFAGDQLRLSLVGRTDKFRADTMRGLLTDYIQLAETLLDLPDQAVDRVR